MDSKKVKAKKHKMGLITFLTLLFIILKLSGKISWPWIWVLSPVWITFVIAVFTFGFILVGGRIKKGKW